MATEMLNKLDDVNIVEARVEAQNLAVRDGRWQRLNHMHPERKLDFIAEGSFKIVEDPFVLLL